MIKDPDGDLGKEIHSLSSARALSVGSSVPAQFGVYYLPSVDVFSSLETLQTPYH